MQLPLPTCRSSGGGKCPKSAGTPVRPQRQAAGPAAHVAGNCIPVSFFMQPVWSILLGEGGPVWPQGWASRTASAEDRGTGTWSPVETRRAVTVQNGKCMGIGVRTSRLWSWLQRQLAWDYAEFPGVSSLGFPSVKQITAPP